MTIMFSILAWRIPWTEGPGGLQSMGLQRVGHDLATNTHTQRSLYIYIERERERASELRAMPGM